MKSTHINIEKAIRICKKYNYFQAPTLFINIRPVTNKIKFIGIYPDNDYKLKTQSDIASDQKFELYKLSLENCFNFILKRDFMFTNLFKETLCLKDELNITPIILSAIRPISELTKYLIEDSQRRNKDLSMKFNGIKNINNFIVKNFLPLTSVIKEYLPYAYFIFQYDFINNEKNIEVSFFFDEPKNDVLLILQKYLYIHTDELQLRNILIPFTKKITFLDTLPQLLSKEVIQSLATITISNISKHIKRYLFNNEQVTYCTYTYLTYAKIMFNSYNTFLEHNEVLYKYYINEECSDTTHFIINNHIFNNYKNKIEKEFFQISFTNKFSLYFNYKDMIKRWEKLENNPESNLYIQQVQEMKLLLSQIKGNGVTSYNTFSIEYTKLLFNCFDISSYYKAYICYILKYLNHEI